MAVVAQPPHLELLNVKRRQQTQHQTRAPQYVHLSGKPQGTPALKPLDKYQVSDVTSPQTSGSIFDPPPQAGFPTPDARDKEFNSRLVAPTVFQEKPFGENVEGLLHCEDASYRSTSVFKWHCTMVELAWFRSAAYSVAQVGGGWHCVTKLGKGGRDVTSTPRKPAL